MIVSRRSFDTFFCVRCLAVKTLKMACDGARDICVKWRDPASREAHRVKRRGEMGSRYLKVKAEVAETEAALSKKKADLEEMVADGPPALAAPPPDSSGGVLGGLPAESSFLPSMRSLKQGDPILQQTAQRMRSAAEALEATLEKCNGELTALKAEEDR